MARTDTSVIDFRIGSLPACHRGPRAWPSSGPIGSFDAAGERTFTPPNAGELLDWVLVLDDERRDYPAPGTVAPR